MAKKKTTKEIVKAIDVIQNNMTVDGQDDEWARAIARAYRDGPAWHERPTCPGMWVCLPDAKSHSHGFRETVLIITADDLKRGVPFHTSVVFGPIPETVATESSEQ